MSEMAMTADHLIVIGRGRLIADTSVDDFIRSASKKAVRVRSPQASVLQELLAGRPVAVSVLEPRLLEIEGLDAAEIGALALRHGVVLHELTPRTRRPRRLRRRLARRRGRPPRPPRHLGAHLRRPPGSGRQALGRAD